ncbi:Bifunctional adenosylcobalamin biosynthesis protein CobU [bioreactor metagenome]|uniref:Adenosylcobinamide kinase n=1 Tax=bioreactor metagenome TaxID=1076179 RepID=A0A645DNU2_9ZZZZ
MRTLVIGGAACGKSEYAEALALDSDGPRYYIATMMPYGDEGLARIEKHRRMRKEKGFITLEQYTDIGSAQIEHGAVALLECLGNLTANALFSPQGSSAEKILDGVLQLENRCETLIIVTNDIFCDGIAYNPSTMRYMQALSALNNALSARFERVVEVVCGIPIYLKGAVG